MVEFFTIEHDINSALRQKKSFDLMEIFLLTQSFCRVLA